MKVTRRHEGQVLQVLGVPRDLAGMQAAMEAFGVRRVA
jgi:hypothetical protein